MEKWYEKMFKNSARMYDKEIFTVGTEGECDFIEKEIDFNKETEIIDIGCGTGRHAIELAKRGYGNITGIDLSDAQLKRAKEKAKEENLNIRFINQDARKLSFRKEFELAIMLCEGGFPLMETDEMNFEILKGASEAIKSGGKFIFTTLNGLFPIYNSIDEFHESVSDGTGATYKSKKFDLMTFRDYNVTEYTDDNGETHQIESDERYYIPSEITWLLKSLDFKNISIYGAKIGAYSREDKLTTEDFEMLVIAERK